MDLPPPWEIFMFHGPPGHDEPWLKPMTDTNRGSSGPPQREATKRRKIEHARAKRRKSNLSRAGTTQDDDEGSQDRGEEVQTPVKGFMDGIVTVLGQVGAALSQ